MVNIQLTNTIFSYLVLFCQAKGASKKEAISWLEKLLTGKLGEASLLSWTQGQEWKLGIDHSI